MRTILVFSSLMKDGNYSNLCPTTALIISFLAHLWRMETYYLFIYYISFIYVFSSLMKDGNYFNMLDFFKVEFRF